MRAGRRTNPMRFRARHWLMLGLALAFALFLGAAAAQDGATRIGYVDMQRLIDNAPQTLAARERLRREFDQRDAELKAEVARLAALDQRVKDEASTLAEPELTALRRQADTLRRSIERTQQRLREEFNTRVDQELERTWPLINEAVAEYAREAGYDLVVPSPVVYVSGRVDITERVLDRLKRDSTQAQP
jgi:outer membrane protein